MIQGCLRINRCQFKGSFILLLTGVVIALTTLPMIDALLTPTSRTTTTSYPSFISIHPLDRFGGEYRPLVVSRLKTSLSMRDDDDDDDDDDDNFMARVPRRRNRGRFFDEQEKDDAFFQSVERQIYGRKDRVYDYDGNDVDDDDDDDDDDRGFFSNVLIENPILDSIDPDGAAERFPELARDPRFWFDMLLFITFLDIISAIGPQNTFADKPFLI